MINKKESLVLILGRFELVHQLFTLHLEYYQTIQEINKLKEPLMFFFILIIFNTFFIMFIDIYTSKNKRQKSV